MNLIPLNFIMLYLMKSMTCQIELTWKYYSSAMEQEIIKNEKYFKWNSKCYWTNRRNGFILHFDGLIHMDQLNQSLFVQCSKNAREEELRNITSKILKISPLPFRSLEVEGCPSNYIGYYLNQRPIILEEVEITCKNYNDSLTVALPLDKLSKIKDLRINCPSWKELPRGLFHGKMKNLVNLQISKTQIQKLDDGVLAELSYLEKLLLENNRIETLKQSDFEGLRSLSELLIIEPQLNFIESDLLLAVPNVNKLYIEGWNVSTLPGSFQNLNLKYLYISNTSMITIVADECKNFASIGTLEITDNKNLTIDPDCFSHLKNIDMFKISGNKKSGFPKKILKWEKLSYLHISDMYWDNCDEGEIKADEKLKFLTMRNISFHILNPLFIYSISKMADSTHLEVLDLSGNNLQTLPYIPDTMYIKHVILSNNRLDFIPDIIFHVMSFAKELYLDGNRLQKFTDAIGIFFNLEVLNLGSNFIKSIPYLYMPKLIHLNLSNNNIDILNFRQFQNCVKLKNLLLSGNHIKEIVSDFKGPVNLWILDISFNSLNYQPKISDPISKLSLSGNNLYNFGLSWVCSMEGLQHLLLRECNISTIISHPYCPLEFSLRILDLSDNHIRSIFWRRSYDKVRKTLGKNSPFSVLRNLEELYLAHNEIEDIPMDMRNVMPKLKRLDLRYNRIKYLLHHDLLYTSSYLMPDDLVIPYDRERQLTVDLRHNSIRGVELPHHMLINNKTHKCDQPRYSHATILLEHNPINCGCEILPLMQVIEGDLILASELWREDKKDWVLQAKLEPGDLKCGHPESVRGKKIMEPETWMHHLLPTIGLCNAIGFLGED